MCYRYNGKVLLLMVVLSLISMASIKPEKIEIIKIGNPGAKKVVTANEDIAKVMDFIKGINVNEKIMIILRDGVIG